MRWRGLLSDLRRVGVVLPGAVLALIGLALVLLLLVAESDEEPVLEQLAYTDADGTLWLVNADGSGRRKLVDDATCGRFSSTGWSPTGDKLMCQSQDGRFVVWDTNGAVLGDVTVPGLWSIVWSPNGDAFLYQTVADPDLGLDATYRLFIANGRGHVIAELGRLQVAVLASVWADYGHPLWSPDGSQLAYRSAETRNVHIYSLDDGTQRVLEGNFYPLGWAMNGDALFVAANYVAPEQEPGPRSYEANLLQLSTGGLTRVPSLDNGVQFWIAPGGTTVVYLTIGQREDGLPGLGVIDLKTGDGGPIPGSLITYGSDYIPNQFLTFTNDGDYIMWNDGDGAAYRARIDGSGLEKLFELDAIAADWSEGASAVAYSDFDDEERVVRLLVTTSDGAATYQIDEKPFGESSTSSFRFDWRPLSP